MFIAILGEGGLNILGDFCPPRGTSNPSGGQMILGYNIVRGTAYPREILSGGTHLGGDRISSYTGPVTCSQTIDEETASTSRAALPLRNQFLFSRHLAWIGNILIMRVKCN